MTSSNNVDTEEASCFICNLSEEDESTFKISSEGILGFRRMLKKNNQSLLSRLNKLWKDKSVYYHPSCRLQILNEKRHLIANVLLTS